jgi:hypothetical protein
MEQDKEILGLRIFLGSFIAELEKLYGKPTLNAMIYRIGQKPGEVVANQILKKNNRSEESPFEIPSAAFNLFENSITQLYEEEHVEFKKINEKRYDIKIKNSCPLREVIKSREELEYGGTLCQFTSGYFESALKILTGMNVSYDFIDKETTGEYCMINLILRDIQKENGLDLEDNSSN